MTSLVVISCPTRAPPCSASVLASEPGGTFDFAFVAGFVCGLALARVFAFAWFALATGFGFATGPAIVFVGVSRAAVLDDASSAAGVLTAGEGASSNRPCSAGLAVSTRKLAIADCRL